MSENRMQEFKQRIKGMLKTKENEPKTDEPTYTEQDIHIVRDTKEGKILICTKEILEKNEERYRITVGANYIGDDQQMAEYELQAVPGGRVCFGGYTNKEVNQDKELYCFSDVWYKLYGTPLQAHQKFTQKDLLAVEQEMEEKWKEAKITQIYSIMCKNQPLTKKAFEGTKYIASCRENQETAPYFEMLEDGNPQIQIVGNVKKGNIALMIEGAKVNIEDLIYGDEIVKSKKSEFKVELVETIGRSRVYTQAKYTKEACQKIIAQYERKQEEWSL